MKRPWIRLSRWKWAERGGHYQKAWEFPRSLNHTRASNDIRIGPLGLNFGHSYHDGQFFLLFYLARNGHMRWSYRIPSYAKAEARRQRRQRVR